MMGTGTSTRARILAALGTIWHEAHEAMRGEDDPATVAYYEGQVDAVIDVATRFDISIAELWDVAPAPAQGVA